MKRVLRLCSGRSLARMPIPICWKCRHHREDISCAAFPHGIPYQILTSEADHHQPFPGDHGVYFEPSVLELVPSPGSDGKLEI